MEDQSKSVSLEEFDLSNYEIDIEGNVYNIKSGILMTKSTHRGKEVINFTDDNGKRRRIGVATLLDYAFPNRIGGAAVNGCTMYKVFDDGRVYSLETSKFLKASVNTSGYKVVNLKYDDGTKKVTYIHKLVAMCFLDGYFENAHVNHIDGNKLNNSVSNLEWCTNEENVKHAWETGLSDGKKRSCKLSLNNEDWVHFGSLKEAKEFIEKEVGCIMPNVSKLSKTAKDNAEEGKTNRGVPNTINPFRCRGFIVKYV